MTTITAQEIRSLHVSYEFRELLVAVNAGAATMAKINGSNVSLAEKKLLIDLLGTVTRAGVMGSLIDLEQKLAALREQTSAGGADPTAANWKTRVIANSGTVSDATLQLVSDFCVSIKGGAHPSFSNLNRVNVNAGGQMAAALVPLVVGGGSAVDTPVLSLTNFSYSENTGLAILALPSDLENLDTGLLLSAFTANLNSLTFGTYSLVVSAVGDSNTSSGAFSSVGNQEASVSTPYSDGVMYGMVGNNGADTYCSFTAPVPPRLVVMSRTDAISMHMYVDGVLKDSQTATTSTLPDLTFSAINNTPPVMAGPVGGYFVGNALDANQIAQLSTAWRVLQQGLGRA